MVGIIQIYKNYYIYKLNNIYFIIYNNKDITNQITQTDPRCIERNVRTYLNIHNIEDRYIAGMTRSEAEQIVAGSEGIQCE